MAFVGETKGTKSPRDLYLEELLTRTKDVYGEKTAEDMKEILERVSAYEYMFAQQKRIK